MLRLFGFLLCGCLACTEEAARQQLAVFGEAVSLQSGEQITFAVSAQQLPADSLQLRLLSVHDSRCPEGVQCIWAGQAVASMQVWTLQDSATVDMCLGSCQNGFKEADTLLLNMHNQAYRLILSAIEPYPVYQQPQQPNRAVIKVLTE